MGKDKINFEVLKEFNSGFDNIFFSISHFNGSTEDFVSDSVEQITGYTPAEIMSFPEKHHSIVCEEDLGFIKKSLTEFENDLSKNSLELIYRINSKSGTQVWLKEFLRLSRKENEITVSEKKSLVLNITNIKCTESEFQKSSEALRELNISKDKFISIVSHDLRAPFTTLLGFSEILLNEQDISEDERNEYLHYIYDASKSQLNLINCLLDWSRLQTGRIKIEPVRLNVKSVVSTAVTPLTGDAVRKNIDVKIDIPVDLYINADERLISQAVVNLATNAIKFTPEGKEIHLSSSRFKEGMIEVIVKDEGVGIAEENHHKLFKIDQKFSLPGTGGEKGSGLGLTLVKEIIEKHGGDIWFYSQVGEGSEFHFTVHEAKNLILIVEEKQNLQDEYRRMLNEISLNYELKFAKNGYDAISVYKSVLPSIIIIDHVMPLMNGIQFVEAINKKESNKPIPIIVTITDYSDTLHDKYESLGINSLIIKPLNDDLLLKTVKQLLN